MGLHGQPGRPIEQADLIGRVTFVGGSHAAICLAADISNRPVNRPATVGRLVGVVTGSSIVIGVITEIAEQPTAQGYNRVAQLDLVGETKLGAAGETVFQRGVSDYPSIGEPAFLLSDKDLALIYGPRKSAHGRIGHVHQDGEIEAHIDIDELVTKHFAILGTTGVGKSSGVVIILRQILAARSNLRIFLVDPHNEYGRCFGDLAQVITPANLRLPFWLFNFEETIDVFFGGRPGIDEEVEILAEMIPLAKSAYLQYASSADRQIVKKKESRSTGFTADTPVPYRIDDLLNLLDEQMGKLENRTSRVVYSRLMSRIQMLRNHPRYGFMFENANIGGDTMADILSHLFRLPPNGKPMTIMQLAGFPAEVVDAVVSVLCRMAFDFGLWSDGAAPLLFICEEAHRYAPAQNKMGFGPTRRALSRIAKEGRKYGVFLGLVTQRPAEIDPTIISQCSTLFVMRMSNDRDQALIRSAVSDAAASFLSFLPSLGTREVFAFGSGVALPTRLKFTELPPELRPNSEAAAIVHNDVGAVDRQSISSVIERWRSASMSHRAASTDTGLPRPLAPRDPPAAYSPSPAVAAPSAAAPPTAPETTPLGLDPQRFRSLKRPSEGVADVFAPSGQPSRWR